MKNKNVVIYPPCEENVAVATKRGFLNKAHSLTTPHRPYGALPPQVGKSTTRGFTLIELLVVVLIIGILAAVAVPQYQKAVLKSRFSTLMPLAKSAWEGNEIYYLNNGNYAETIDELDVSAPTQSNIQVVLGDEEKHQYVRVSDTNLPNRITMYQKHSANFPEETHCEALLNNDLANNLCQDSLQGTFVGNKSGYAVYTLSAQAVGSLLRNYENKNNVVLEAGETCTASEGGWCKSINATGGKCVAEVSAYGNTSCAGTFKDGAICETERRTGYACGGAFSNNSVCRGYATYMCQRSSFNHSSCEVITDPQTPYSGRYGCNDARFTNYSSCTGNEWSACNKAHFTDHSVCKATVARICHNATYDDTSYCESENGFCPVGARKENGDTWQLCEGEPDGGKTC